METQLSRVIKNVATVVPKKDKLHEQLEKIEMKSQFRAPEMIEHSWIELATLVKTMPVNFLAQFLINQSDAFVFTAGELREINTALFKNRRNIDKFIASEKTNEQDEEVGREWLLHNSSANTKISARLFPELESL